MFFKRVKRESGMKEHWDKVYSSNDTEKLGWYEETPIPFMKLLSKCHISNDASILDVGAGATTLIDYLINTGYTNITVADISEVGLKQLKGRLGKEKNLLSLSFRGKRVFIHYLIPAGSCL